jgi:NAD(P)-dependent dehydrogenase (short-subunit alcohol dehydrogenase family)
LIDPMGGVPSALAIEVLDVNLRAEALLCRCCCPTLERSVRDGGAPAIVGISSIEGLAANPYIPACASKAGLLGMTRSMSPKASFITGSHLVVDGAVTSRHA